MWRRYCTVFLLCLALCPLPNPAEAALCSGDLWGGRVSSIDRKNAEVVTIIAQTNVVHVVPHPVCQGNFSAHVRLLAVGANCPSTNNQTHFPSGVPTLAWAQTDCVIPACDFTYHAGGIHDGFGEPTYYSESPGSVRNDCPPPPCLPDQSICEFDNQCCSGFCGIETNRCGSNSPLLVNLAGNSHNLQLTNAASGVDFDIDAGGQAERVSWTEEGS